MMSLKRSKGKMFKKILSVFLAMVISIGFISVGMLSASAADSGDGWSLDDNGVLTIMSDTGMTGWRTWDNINAVRTVVIQDGVTNIGHAAFMNCVELTNVSIGSGVTNIGSQAFENCTNLTEITIGNSVTSIGEDAFYDCTGLTSMTFKSRRPPSFSIWEGVFEGVPSSMTVYVPFGAKAAYQAEIHLSRFNIVEGEKEDDLIIGDGWSLDDNGLLTIENDTGMRNWAWGEGEHYSNAVRAVVIQDSVTSVLDWAFINYVELTNVSIGSGVTRISYRAFFSCTALTEIKVSANNQYFTDIDGVLFNKNVTELIQYPGGKEGSGYTIPNSVRSIGEGAFEGCVGLTSVTIPDSVTSIGFGAFAWCDMLTEIKVSANNQYFTDIDGVLFNKSVTELIQYPGGKQGSSYTIPNSVTTIGWGAFEGCQELTVITIPDSVTSIEERAFYWCTGLTEIKVSANNQYFTDIDGVLFNKAATTLITYPPGRQGGYTIPNSVTSIGDSAFNTCYGLTSVTIPDRVTSIGYDAFFYCEGLTSVTIPDSVISIGGWAFSYCEGLTRVVFKSQTPPEFGFNVFWNGSSSMTVYVPIGARAAYQVEDELSGFNIVEGEPSAFVPCGDYCKGEGNCDEPCVFTPCGDYCKGFGKCEDPCVFILGDCNRDGKINIADLTYLKYAIVKQLPETPECFIAGNETIGAVDITQLKDFLTGKSRTLTSS
ncbi:MAG: leucine-rich repeat protein [Oscillospiraceae bacterium]|nr:leucine-rich repeat protein [Oscillospiraceae bacterium]